MAENIVTPEFRVSFPQVFKPKHNKLSKKDEYSLQALFPKGADLSKLYALAAKVAEEKFGPNFKTMKLRSPFRDQADREKMNDDGTKFMPEGYEKGAIYLNLRSEYKPNVVDENVQPILVESDFYPGCWARASLSCYAYDQGGNKGVNFGLQNLQKTRDGESFSGRTKAEDDFAPVSAAGGGVVGGPASADPFG